MAAPGISGLTAFVTSREPGDRHQGLFWAACRAAQDGLDPAPLAAAAEAAGLSHGDAEHAIASAAQVIATARRDHATVHPTTHAALRPGGSR
jgi:hypothetical protein